MGIETEYGITVPNAADFNPVLASSLLINSYAAQALRPVREAPVPTEEDLGLANVILTNGARYYVDHAHPEFSTPECTNPRQLVVYDKAGERILESSIERATAMMPAGGRVIVYKNNTDGKGASYGTHENYLVDRAVPFVRIARDIMPFFVSRQIYTGAGLLSAGERGRDVPFQVSQRADFFEAE